MRIAVVHSFYSSRTSGGENRVVHDEVAALRRRGHDVLLASQSTDERASRGSYALEAAATVATNVGPSPAAALRRFAPDVVHVHNLFPNFGRRWALRSPSALTVTLHNFRLLCAAGSLYRDGSHCMDCLGRVPVPALRHGCYRGSRVATFPLTIPMARGPGRDPVLTSADVVITLSEAMRRIYERSGVPAEKLRVGRNFLPDHRVPPNRETWGEAGWLYVGALHRDKGILDLLARWPDQHTLRVVGWSDDNGLDVARSYSSPHIQVLGPQPRETVLELMGQSTGLVLPSLWLEGLPLVYVEALASGLPVLAFDTNVVAQFVRDQGTGAVVSWEDDLRSALDAATAAFPDLRVHCRARFDHLYAEDVVMQDLESVFGEAIRRRSTA